MILPPDLIFVKLAPEKSAYDSVVPYKFAPDKSDSVNFTYARFTPFKSTPINPPPYATPLAAANVATVIFDKSTLGPTKYPPRISYPDPDWNVGGCPAVYVIPPDRVPTNVVIEPAFTNTVFVKSTFAIMAESSVFPVSEMFGPTMKFDPPLLVTNLYPAGKFDDASNVTLSDTLPLITAPLISTLVKFVFMNAAPRKFVPLKSTSGPIMYPPDPVTASVATYR